MAYIPTTYFPARNVKDTLRGLVTGIVKWAKPARTIPKKKSDILSDGLMNDLGLTAGDVEQIPGISSMAARSQAAQEQLEKALRVKTC